jgi:putative SOS response-associated peptidase YedK
MIPQYKVVAYRQGLVMSTEHCDNWLEADQAAEEMLQRGTLYDEVRIIRIENKGENNA